MVDIIVLCGWSAVLLNKERLLSSETIVSHSDFLTIADAVSFLVSWKTLGETAHVGNLFSKFNIVGSVHQDGENSLSGTGIVDNLFCVEQLWVIICQRFSLFCFLDPLEKEDKSIDGSE